MSKVRTARHFKHMFWIKGDHMESSQIDFVYVFKLQFYSYLIIIYKNTKDKRQRTKSKFQRARIFSSIAEF